MKSVMISIQPKWCELIASGKKTVEVRKTRPKIDVPFKCYIYCTKQFYRKGDGYFQGKYCGKVIGEFVCDAVEHYTSNCTVFESVLLPSPEELEEMCLTLDELNGYGTRGKILYGWHISDLVIYEQPKELSEFYTKCEKFACEGCEHLKYQRVNADEYDYECEYFNYHIPITRPPQSWCYVEELKGDGEQ